MDHARTRRRQVPRLQEQLRTWCDALALRLAGAPSTPGIDIHAVSYGESAPRIRRTDLEGNVVDLVLFQDEPILLLFWSPGCGYCQALLSHMLAFERSPNRARMVVLSGGTISVNRELGFVSPVVLDDDRAIAQAFGDTGTPAAVLIGAQGIVAAEVARGATAVRAYVYRCVAGGTLPARDQTDFS